MIPFPSTPSQCLYVETRNPGTMFDTHLSQPSMSDCANTHTQTHTHFTPWAPCKSASLLIPKLTHPLTDFLQHFPEGRSSAYLSIFKTTA